MRNKIYKIFLKFIKVKKLKPQHVEMIMIMKIKDEHAVNQHINKQAAVLAQPTAPKGAILAWDLSGDCTIPEGYVEVDVEVGILPTRMAFKILFRDIRRAL